MQPATLSLAATTFQRRGRIANPSGGPFPGTPVAARCNKVHARLLRYPATDPVPAELF